MFHRTEVGSGEWKSIGGRHSGCHRSHREVDRDDAAVVVVFLQSPLTRWAGRLWIGGGVRPECRGAQKQLVRLPIRVSAGFVERFGTVVQLAVANPALFCVFL